MKKKNLKFSLIAFIIVLFMPFVVNAKVIEADDYLNLKNEENSTKVAFAADIKNSASIDGIFAAFGNQISSEGKLTYGAFAGNEVIINDNLEKDLFVAGNTITVGENAILTRDVFIAGNIVNINANVGRNMRIAASSVNLSNVTISGNVTIYAESITFNENTKIAGNLTYYEDTKIEGLKEENVGKINIKEVSIESDKQKITTTAMDALTTILSRYVTMVIILVLFGKLKKHLDSEKISVETVGYDLLKGFGVLIIVPLASLIFLFSSLFSALSMIMLALYVIALYISMLISSYIVGSQIWKKFKKNSNIYIEVLIGVVVVKLVTYIPIIGGIVSFACLIFGLGLIYNLFRKNIGKQ